MATVYCRKNQLYLHSNSETVMGVLMATPPFRTLPRDDLSQIGNAVLLSLSSSLRNLPTPERGTPVLAPLYELAATKTWSEFARNAKCVTIEHISKEIILLPHRNLGATHGFEPVHASQLSLEEICSAKELGAALLEAFNRCE